MIVQTQCGRSATHIRGHEFYVGTNTKRGLRGKAGNFSKKISKTNNRVSLKLALGIRVVLGRLGHILKVASWVGKINGGKEEKDVRSRVRYSLNSRI